MNPPFPFNAPRNTTAEDKLFGERKAGFRFEHIASEFENSYYEEADSGIESEVSSSTLSPGSSVLTPSMFSPLSVSSLASPPVASHAAISPSVSVSPHFVSVCDDSKPLCLVKKEKKQECEEEEKVEKSPVVSKHPKHWKKSLTRNFLDTKSSENKSPRKVNVLKNISNIMPTVSSTTRSADVKPKIVQPWNIDSKCTKPAPKEIKTEPALPLVTSRVNVSFTSSSPIPVVSIPEPAKFSLPALFPALQEQQHSSNIHSGSSYLYLNSPLVSSPSSGQHCFPVSSLPSTIPTSSAAHGPGSATSNPAHFYQNTIFSGPISPVSLPQHQHHHQQPTIVASPTSTSENNPTMYYCAECKKSFCTESGYIKHQHLHSSNQIQKQFSCKYCQKTYNSQSALKMHIRTHTLPCKCPECGKSFSRPWLLQGHMRTHTGEKPFSCTHCSRNFADKSNLRAHLQTHLQNKKYSCPGCRKSFSRMSLLTKHTESGCRPVAAVAQPLLDLSNLM